jgi:hypothetical protein
MLLTVEDVTAWVPQASGDTALIESAIEQATALASGYCRRVLEQADRDERYDVEAGQTLLQLRQYPVTEVAAVYLDPDDTNELLSEIDDYLVDGSAGVLTRLNTTWPVQTPGIEGHWPPGSAIVRVQYTAGYTPEDLSDEQGDLKVALLELVGWRLGWRGGAGVGQQALDGVSTTREPLVRGIPESTAGMLERYVRIV